VEEEFVIDRVQEVFPFSAEHDGPTGYGLIQLK